MDLYSKIESYAKSPHLLLILCAISFAESSFFPIPPDVLLVPAIVADRSNAYRYAWHCSISSVLGGLVGYFIGVFLFDTIGEWIISTYNYEAQFAAFSEGFGKYAFWVIALKGLTPIPYKLVAIAAGVASVDLKVFFIASIVARFSRFFILSYLSVKFGPMIGSVLKKHMWLFFVVICAVVVLGFWVLKLV